VQHQQQAATTRPLAERVALITGPKRIGAVVAREFAAHGADVALSYNRSRREAEEAAAAVRAEERRAVVLQADLSHPEACSRVVNEAAAALGRLDILVNMASVYIRHDFDAMTTDDWERALAIDLRAAFLCARAAVPHMRRIGSGRIVNIADWVAASRRPRYKGYVAYYVAKSGVIALTEALALELAGDNILVNAVAPGPILAPPGVTAEELKEVEEATPLGRWGGEMEIAKAVLALVEAEFITGETIRVDGGRHLS
jgi:NAD(P)-dependent dehydrogenase (short-subunit alcohol dehydrogenase family)